MKTLKKPFNKAFKIGASRTSYMIFAISSTLFFYLILFFKPSYSSTLFWFIPLSIILYISLIILLFLKGRKLVLSDETIILKGWFSSKKININDIDSYKVLSSSYTGSDKIISIFTKGNEKTEFIINSFPNQDISEFINWLDDELKVKNTKLITSSNSSETKHNIKTYKVGKSNITSYLIFSSFILMIIISIILSEFNFISSTILMYIQVGGAIFFIIGFIIYSMFIHNEITISKDTLNLKGFFINRSLKFNEIKGYKTVYTPILKRYKYILIVPFNKRKKEIIIRPINRMKFIELTDWIEKSIVNLEK